MAIFIIMLAGMAAVVSVLCYIGYQRLEARSRLVVETTLALQVMVRKKMDLTQQIVTVCQSRADQGKLPDLKASGGMVASVADLEPANAHADQVLDYVSQLARRFPALREDDRFARLHDQLTKLEQHLQTKHEQYNLQVDNYNSTRLAVPAALVAQVLKYPEAPRLKLKDWLAATAARN